MVSVFWSKQRTRGLEEVRQKTLPREERFSKMIKQESGGRARLETEVLGRDLSGGPEDLSDGHTLHEVQVHRREK